MTSSKPITILPALLLWLLAVVDLKAQNWQDDFTFNGFYSIDLSMADDDLVVIGTGGARALEANQPTFNQSLFGAQLSYQFNEHFSATVQGVVSLDRNDSVDFNLDWGYFSYQFDNDWQLRAGRYQIPFLQGTELRSVGFTRLWARPLAPGSGAGGFNWYNGIEILKKISGDHGSWEFQLGGGKARHGLANQIDNDDMFLFTTRYMADDFWLRSSLLHANYRVLTPRGALINDAGNVLMGSLETEWRPGNWVLHAGTSTTRADTTPDDSMTYLSVGHQFGAVTPYLLGIYRNQFFEPFEPPPPPGGGPPGGGPVGGGPGNRPPPPPDGDSNVYSSAIGLRWDFKPAMSLKIQLEQLKIDNQSRPQQGRVIQEGRVLSVILEGVF